MTDPDLVVVGAGPFGLTVARVAAERGRRVAVVERREHIGGNAHSSVDPATGIEIHNYGAHLFHTSNERVWDFLGRFTDWTDYTHRVFTRHRGEVYPLPINLGTINQFFRSALSPDEARRLIAEQAGESAPPGVGGTGVGGTGVAGTGAAGIGGASGGAQTASDIGLEAKAVSLIGRPLYEAFIRDYTAKQWQTPADQLPAAVIGRLPVRYNYDSRYFSDRHQGLPAQGYAALWSRLADHPGIEVVLGQDFLTPPDAARLSRAACAGQVPVVFTGPIDRYFGHAAGPLGWRTLDFAWERPATGDHQGCAVMNYADLADPWTRVIEFRHFHPERDYPADRTIIAREFSRLAEPGDEPYYPVATPADRDRLERYRELASQEHEVWFGGRLGRYQYLDMDMAVAAALTLADKLVPAGCSHGLDQRE
ncbi:MAG: FAD-dependent oxidoreductase [Bifidobacteriaceae bacterium]|jgi:UDP-galactopyranose mutase|nr:FAD-dependent oxidoreductase [Bifidobacteriaceae bacterium]